MGSHSSNSHLGKEFAIKDLGPLDLFIYFGIEAAPSSISLIFLSKNMCYSFFIALI